MADIAASADTKSDATEELNFEDAVSRLEALVSSLEGGELGLEASISAYEDGLRLARSCIERLDEAELRVQQLSDLTGDLASGRSSGTDPMD
jgi:exodeoxyribonuclease VII small subunit